jgi:hypothetical protein
MNTIKMPGFTAETSLYRGNRNYCAIAVTATVPEAGTLTPATRKNGKLEWIDCNDFPANNWCRECGNTGPDAAICCPDDYCVIIDKTPLTGGKNRGLFGIADRTSFARI